MHEEKVWKWPNYILERMPNYSIRHKGKKKKKPLSVRTEKSVLVAAND